MRLGSRRSQDVWWGWSREPSDKTRWTLPPSGTRAICDSVTSGSEGSPPQRGWYRHSFPSSLISWQEPKGREAQFQTSRKMRRGRTDLTKDDLYKAKKRWGVDEFWTTRGKNKDYIHVFICVDIREGLWAMKQDRMLCFLLVVRVHPVSLTRFA